MFKENGYRDGLDAEVLASKASGPKFDPYHPCNLKKKKKVKLVTYACSLSTRDYKRKLEAPEASLARQSSLLGEVV